MSGSPPAVAPVDRDPAPPTRRRRRRRWPIVLAVVLLLLVLLAAIAFVVADRIVRARAETEIEQRVGSSLPAGVTGRVAATVEGAWVLPQLLQGQFDHVTVVSRGLRVEGAPAAATVDLYGVPVEGGTIGQATGDLTVSQSVFRGLPELRRLRASDPVIGDGTVSTTITQTLLSLPVQVRVVLKPRLKDQTVLLEPVDATITAGPASVPATAIVQQVLPKGVSLCAASSLPEGVRVESLRARPGRVTVGLTAFQLDVDHLDTAPRGSCA